ncbi:MAG: PilZ domain-containing protein [Pirellulales bacterium]|nr:PilZ domain-containing protein [Pirellulales bacterium]
MNKHQRTEERASTSLEAVVFLNGERISCRVRNISAHGAKISDGPEAHPGDPVSLNFMPFGTILGTVVWHANGSSGIQFHDSAKAVEDVLLGLATYAMI